MSGNMQVYTPNATLGIRGTTGMGEVATLPAKLPPNFILMPTAESGE
jgi:hypothetical protein